MTIREAAARLVVDRLRLGGAFFTYETILSLAMREAQVLGLTERDMETAVCEKFCSQTELGRTALEMYKDSRNHEEIRGCGNEIKWLICREADQYSDLQPGGALHATCARLIAAANAAARQDIRSILRGD
jgi:hypothetical protein